MNFLKSLFTQKVKKEELEVLPKELEVLPKELEVLPKELEDIVIDYKKQLIQYQKFKNELGNYVTGKRKYIKYSYRIDENFKYSILSIINVKDTRFGKINMNFWESEDCKKYITDSRIEYDVMCYGLFETIGKIEWDY